MEEMRPQPVMSRPDSTGRRSSAETASCVSATAPRSDRLNCAGSAHGRSRMVSVVRHSRTSNDPVYPRVMAGTCAIDALPAAGPLTYTALQCVHGTEITALGDRWGCLALLPVRTQADGRRGAGPRQDGPEAAGQPAAADGVDQGLDAAVGELVGAPRGEGAAAAGQAPELGRVQPQVAQRQQAQLVHLGRAQIRESGLGVG